MKTLNPLILYIFLVLLSGEIIAQEDTPPDPKFGKCYAKCPLPEYEVIEETFDIYLGDSNDEIEFDSIYFEIATQTGDLIYRGSESDLSRKQRKRIENFVKLVFVKDANGMNDDIVQETYIYKEWVGPGGSAWEEILCQADANSSMIEEIENFLIEKGYLKDLLAQGKMTGNVRKALTKYQSENNLPVGNLNIKTLKAMGIY